LSVFENAENKIHLMKCVLPRGTLKDVPKRKETEGSVGVEKQLRCITRVHSLHVH